MSAYQIIDGPISSLSEPNYESFLLLLLAQVTRRVTREIISITIVMKDHWIPSFLFAALVPLESYCFG